MKFSPVNAARKALAWLSVRGNGRRFDRALVFVGAMVAYLAALEYAYAQIVAPAFGYLGYIYHTPPRIWMLVSFVLLLAVAALLPARIHEPSDIVIWFMYVAVVVPIAQIPFYGGSQSAQLTLAYGSFACAVLLAISWVVSRRPAEFIPLGVSHRHVFTAVICVFSAATYVYLFFVFGTGLNLVAVFDVYDTRMLYRDEIIPAEPLLGYLIANQSNVVNPLLIGYGIAQRRWLVSAAGVIGQLYIYSATGSRTALVAIPLALVLGIVVRNRRTIRAELFVASVAVLCWAAILIDKIVPLGSVNLIVSRIFITAGYLTPAYLEVYSDGDWAIWSYSFLAPFIDNDHNTTPGFRVGAEAFGRPDIQANANLFADGYANLGHAGVIIEALLLVLLLILLNSAARGLPLVVVLPALIVPAWSISNGSPFTAILTYGFLLAAILFAIYPRTGSSGILPARGSLHLPRWSSGLKPSTSGSDHAPSR